jgi:cell division protein ZapA (FtsZ GTPase activity inhibitor)
VHCVTEKVTELSEQAQMGEISIKINIADRVYPLKVNMEEEELIRRAAKLINDRIKDYQENYAVKDKQDLLSMCVLHYATATLKAEQKVVVEDTTVAEKVYKLDDLLNNFFAKQ